MIQRRMRGSGGSELVIHHIEGGSHLEELPGLVGLGELVPMNVKLVEDDPRDAVQGLVESHPGLFQQGLVLDDGFRLSSLGKLLDWCRNGPRRARDEPLDGRNA